MKIAMMTNNYKPFIGGVPVSIERLTMALREQGHRVVVFAPQYCQAGQGEVAQEQEPDVIRYRTLSQHFYGNTVLPNPLDPVLEKTFARESFDVIHVHHPVLIGRTAAYLADKYGIPLVYTYHTQYEQYLEYAGFIHWLSCGENHPNLLGRIRSRSSRIIKREIVPRYLNTFMRRCATVITPTEGMRKAFLQQYRYSYGCGAQVEVLPTGLLEENYRADPAVMQELRRKYEADRIPLLITVSRLGHEKNIPFLLRAMAALKRRLPAFRLLVIGEGPQQAEYIELCKELDIQKEICFLGKLPNGEIPSYMAAADCFVFASKTETQGIVILEAMAAGTPVVAVKASGAEDLVKDGVCGYLCPEEEEAFAEQLLRVLQNEPLRERLRVGAYEEALAYREDAVAQKAARIYTDTCRRYAQAHTVNCSRAGAKRAAERLGLPG